AGPGSWAAVEGKPGPDPEAAAWARAGVKLAAERGHPFPHPGDSVAAGWMVTGTGPAAVVVHLHGDLLLAVADEHGGSGRPGMAGHVGQRLLHDPVGRYVDPERHRANRPFGLRPDLQARRGRLRDQVPEPGQGRGGGARRALAV